jgi:hypothetical protein
MDARRGIFAMLVLVASLLGAACGASQAEPAAPESPAQVEPIAGTNLKQVTLTERAVERLGIQTTEVASGSAGQTSVPYAAVFYTADGQTWVYTNPEGSSYVRAPVEIVTVTDGTAELSSSPPAGTLVVTVGVAELFGTETGVGEPE